MTATAEDRLTATRLYLELVMEGDPRPVAFICRTMGVSRATVHRWLMAAKESGELVVPEHRPRHARWGGQSPTSWLACRTCRQPWPCPSAS